MTNNPAARSAIKHALSTTRQGDFAQWYQEVISAAELAEEFAREAALRECIGRGGAGNSAADNCNGFHENGSRTSRGWGPHGNPSRTAYQTPPLSWT